MGPRVGRGLSEYSRNRETWATAHPIGAGVLFGLLALPELFVVLWLTAPVFAFAAILIAAIAASVLAVAWTARWRTQRPK